MNFIFTGVFWGSLLILGGLSVILNSVFNINIPIFRIVFALFILWIGISMLMGGFKVQGDDSTAVFGEKNIKATKDNKNITAVFGSVKADLSELTVKDGPVEISSVFGGSEITISKKVPTKVVANAAFGGVETPDGDTAAFGTNTYTNSAYKEGKEYLEIRVNAVFGGAEVREE